MHFSRVDASRAALLVLSVRVTCGLERCARSCGCGRPQWLFGHWLQQPEHSLFTSVSCLELPPDLVFLGAEVFKLCCLGARVRVMRTSAVQNVHPHIVLCQTR